MKQLLPQDTEHCWAVALGGTRRAYLAQGGTLATTSDLDAYFQWVEQVQLGLLDHLYNLGVQTIITIGRLPADRGAVYSQYAQRAVDSVVNGAERRAFYRRRQLQVSVAGDLGALAHHVHSPALADECRALREATHAGSGGKLIYLFRGDWVSTAEEGQWGYTLGQELGRMPTRDELVRAFYGLDVPPLSVYLGSGRPRIGILRPPFLSGHEDCYWSATCPVRLHDAHWREFVEDHLSARRTQSARSYPADAASRAALQRAITAADGRVVGVGYRHELGFWLPR